MCFVSILYIIKIWFVVFLFLMFLFLSVADLKVHRLDSFLSLIW